MITGYTLFFITPSGYDFTVAIISGVFLGLFFAGFYGVIWPCVTLLVEENLKGTGVGLITASYNIGISFGPFIIGGLIKD